MNKKRITTLLLLACLFFSIPTAWAAGSILNIDGVSRLKNLERLILPNQNIASIPDELGNLPKLKELDLSGNKLSVVSKGITDAEGLEILDLSNNLLTTIPDEISQLDKLKRLSIASNTEVKHLPNSMENMVNLESIDVTNTSIKCLPIAMEPIAISEKKPDGITYGLTVTFDTGGGSVIDNVRVDQDQKITAIPTDPTRNGFSFSGWFADSAKTDPWDFSTDLVSDHITLYAKWSGSPSQLIFVENGGSETADLTGVTEETITNRNMPNTTRSGYTLVGWYEQDNFTGAKIEQLPDKFPVGSIIYYAKWTANASTIEFEVNSGSPTPATLTGVTDQAITDRDMPTITRDGYTFAGWYEASNFSGSEITQLPVKYPVSGVKYHAKWTANASTIEFEVNSGSPTPATLTGVTDQAIADRDMPTITRDGYTFAGWYEASNFSGSEITQLPVKYPVLGVKYHAKWTANASTIEFEVNSGSPTPATLTGVTDQAIADRDMPIITRDGYTFAGWYEASNFSGSEVAQLPDKYPISGVKYHAKWTANASTIEFEVNSGSPAPVTLTGVTDQAITDRAMPTITRDGYTFAGWYEASNFSGSEVTQLPDKYPVSGVKYHAKWTANASTIEFEVNSGSPVPATLTGVTDQAITDRDMPTITRDGYTFAGWYEASNFSGSEVTQLPDKYPVSGVNYHAKWTANASTIEFEANIGSPVPATLTGVTDQAITDRDMPTITRDGYTFAGWYEASNFSGSEVTQLPDKYPISGIKYHAKWSSNASSITFEENGGSAAFDLGGVTDQPISNRDMPTITRSGYSFAGWYEASNFSGAVVTQLPATYPVGSLTYHAKWTANASTIAFEENSGTTTPDLTGVTDQAITDRDMPTITRVGYTLDGWYAASNFSGAVVTQLPAMYPVTGITYYAKWTINTYTISFNSNGGSAVGLKVATHGATITAPTEPTKANAFFDAWYKDAGLTQLWNFSTDVVTSNMTLYAKWTNLPPAGSLLSSYTWPEIQLISEAGKGDEYFNVGDTKNLTLSTGEVLTMQIYGFDHDNKADNSGKAGITFGTQHLMANNRAINPGNNTNAYGWEGSDIRGWMNGISTQYAGTNYTSGTTSLYSQLPAEIKSAIKPVKKLTSGGYNNNVLVTSTDKLFAFSEVELFGATYYSIAGEGTKYPIFTGDASRIKKMSNGSGSANHYWGRSPYSGTNGYFTLVSYNGTYTNGTAGYSWGVAFGFCI